MGMLRTIATSLERRDGIPLGGINNPNTPLYQALTGMLDGLGLSIEGLPAVNYETATRLPAVYRAVMIIAGTIASLPGHLYTKQGGDDDSRVRLSATHPASWLEQSPNPEMLPSTFWLVSVAHNVLSKGTLWLVAKDGLGRSRELWPIEPRRWDVRRDSDGRRVFIIDGSDAHYDYQADGTGDIVYIPSFTLDGLRGRSAIEGSRTTLQLALAAEEFLARVLAQGSWLGGILTTDQPIPDAEAERLARRFMAVNAGVRRAGRIAVLGRGARFQATTLSPEQAQTADTRRQQLGEIERLTGIAPHLLADTERSTSWGSGILEQNMNTLTYTLGPYVKRFEEAVTYRVLARWPQIYWRFDLRALLRPDMVRRYQSYAVARQWGWLSVNDIRRLEDMEPIADGDDYLQPMNMEPIGAGQSASLDAVRDMLASAGLDDDTLSRLLARLDEMQAMTA